MLARRGESAAKKLVLGVEMRERVQPCASPMPLVLVAVLPQV